MSTTTNNNNPGSSGNAGGSSGNTGGSSGSGRSGVAAPTGTNTTVVHLFGDKIKLTQDELDEYNSKYLPKCSKMATLFNKDDPSMLNGWIEDTT